MKISLAISDLSVRGGTHKQLLRLAQFLARKGDEVEILTNEYSPDTCYPEFREFEVKTPPAYRRSVRPHKLQNVLNSFYLARMIDPSSSVLNVHDQGCELLAFWALHLRKDLRLVWQVNDLHPAFRIGPFSGTKALWKHPVQRWMARYIARKSNDVTVNVSKNADRVRQLLSVAPKVFHCGVDRLSDVPIPRLIGAPLELVSVGVFFRYRNYEAILSAMQMLRDEGIESRLTIIGTTKYDGEYEQELRQLAEALRLSLHIAGEVDEERFHQLLQRANVFVFVNKDQSWGLSVFEAMSMSLPVVVSNTVGAVELLGGTRAALLVNPEDCAEIARAIKDVTASQSTYNEFALAAFEETKNLTWDKLYSRNMRDLFDANIT